MNQAPKETLGRIKLFRSEAIKAAHQRTWLGEVEIDPPVAYGVLLFTFIIFFLGLITIANFTSYQKKVTANGTLVATSGKTNSYAENRGKVVAIYYQAGDVVKRGDVICSIDASAFDAFGNQIESEIIRSLKSEKKLADETYAASIEKASYDAYLNQVLTESAKRQVMLIGEALHQKEIVYERLRDNWNKYETLYTEKAISLIEYMNQARYLSESKIQLKTAALQLEQLTVNLKSLEVNQKTLKHQEKEERIKHDKKTLSLNASIRSAIDTYRFSVISDVNGTLSDVSVKLGDYVQPGARISSIVTNSVTLAGQISIPANKIPFVQVGQRVLIQYDAFPHRKFGNFKASVGRVGVTEATENTLTSYSGTPFYTATLDLQAEGFSFNGMEVKLHSGYTFKSLIIIEEETVLEWLIDSIRNIGA